MPRPLSCYLLAVTLLAASIRVTSAQTPPPAAEAVTLPGPQGPLAGTLLIPSSKDSMPVVLLIAGSGPTDRDGNGPGFTPASLRQLAESLASHGIATLRFDKRGIGGSAAAMMPESDLRFEMLANDVAGWIRQLGGDKRFSRVIVAGHSEGALLGLLALRTSPAAAYISLEGPARPADEVIHDQLARQLPPELMAESDTIMARLKRGITTDSTPAVLAALFRPSVQPYLISWFKYSAATELAQLKVPCLVVQGTHDLQVDTTEADLLQQANPRCTMARIEGMNHVLKMTPADMASQMPSYRGPDAPLSEELVSAVVSFVTGLGR
ncbi:MAG TPA: alpha/beta hydrolase [Gemmatimonadales bacterium]|jgi:pimeloyl-ACP methyl ester carboxylesterase|nr:alpha/beta hydrolase [Gemmatimonadales bacterium]